MPIDARQYDSAIDFIEHDREFSKLVGNLTNNDDKARIKAYELYEDFYHNRPEHIRVTLRGEDDDSVEIYVPSLKKYVEAINRFLAVNFQYYIDPDGSGNADEQANVDNALATLFKNEKVLAKFNKMKRYMLMKGDACFHVVGLPWERPGKRVKIYELKPEHYFPIEDPVTGHVMGAHIVDIIGNPRNTPSTQRYTGDFLVRRQTYRRMVNEDTNLPTGAITSELSLWEIGRWDDRLPIPLRTQSLSLVDMIQEEHELPKEITQIPVFHWAHNSPPNSTFGMSVAAGIESILSAINQAMSDEDLTLITQGLGVYWTDASPPVDEFGNETEWEIGPGAVVRVGAGGNFNRVSGVSSVSPYLDHVKQLDEFAQQGLGVPDIAIGMVDVQTAESGIALQLKFGPMLAANAETELTMVDTTDDFLSSLVNGFIPAYEKVPNNGQIEATTQFDDAMPKNQDQELTNILSIWQQTEGVTGVEWLYTQLNDIMGYELDYNSDFDTAVEDMTKIAGAAGGPTMMGGGPNGSDFANQLDQQLGDSQNAGLNGNKYDFSSMNG